MMSSIEKNTSNLTTLVLTFRGPKYIFQVLKQESDGSVIYNVDADPDDFEFLDAQEARCVEVTSTTMAEDIFKHYSTERLDLLCDVFYRREENQVGEIVFDFLGLSPCTKRFKSAVELEFSFAT